MTNTETVTLSQAEKELGLIKDRVLTNLELAGVSIEEWQNAKTKDKLRVKVYKNIEEKRLELCPFKYDQIRAILPELNDYPNDKVPYSWAWQKYVAERHPGYKKALEEQQAKQKILAKERIKQTYIDNHEDMPEDMKEIAIKYATDTSFDDGWMGYLLRNKKISPDFREEIVCDFLGINRASVEVGGFDGTTKNGREVEIKTEQARIGEARKLNGAHQFSTLCIPSMEKKIQENPIMAHAGFVDGRLAYLATWMLKEMDHKRLLSEGTIHRNYRVDDWMHLPFRLQFVDYSLLEGYTALKLMATLQSKKIHKNKNK